MISGGIPKREVAWEGKDQQWDLETQVKDMKLNVVMSQHQTSDITDVKM